MTALTERADVVVVGGGPAGSTAATLIARRGHRVVLLERDSFPRYQIGESLLPATVHGVCRLLGVEDELAQAGFTVKRGGTFRWGTNPEPWTFQFASSARMDGPTSFAYQVERTKFDAILLRNAARNGVDVRELAQVVSVQTACGSVSGVAYHDKDGINRVIESQYVVDASGNTGTVHRNVGGERVYSPFFRNIALFGYYDGGKRMPEPRSGNILSAAFSDGWFWYIPLSDTLTSVGAVVRRESADLVRGDRGAALNSLVSACPLIADMLGGATMCTTAPYDEIRIRKDYSYCGTRFWRPGMALVGDAACFVDPVFSSGVHLATYSALLAARSINSVLAGDVRESDAFAEFERRYRREYRLFYEFLLSFYEMDQQEESYFWNAKRVTGSNVSELEAFVELVGGVASDEQVLARSAAEIADRTTRNADLLAAAIGDDAAGNSTGSLLSTGSFDEVMGEGARMQAHSLLGNGFTDTPLFEGGLAGSADGLGWVRA
ncbi:FAD-dependent oxidoreductase [Amycolatopsis sp. NPDC059090]|uniref:FAD-dependent oxidoreductase n=1 Tax=Amycolatopsis sp. NPDC059090 TaxID=3346723 RepID=UPI00366E3B65